MEVGDFTAAFNCRERISPSRSAKISFVTVFQQIKGTSFPAPNFALGAA